jgi:acetylglutamate kinase
MVTSEATDAPIVIKIGGSFFSLLESNLEASKALLNTISHLQAKHKSVVIVHGGGDQVLKRLNALGFTSLRKEGLRVTPDTHMPIVTSVLAGELNKQLVAECAKYNINAVGISLADGNMTTCHEHPADIGAVGVPTTKSATLLHALLEANMVPIVASVGKDDSGRLYNVNADHAAICIAQLLNTKLYFFADVSGVLDENKQLISTLNSKLSKPLVSRGIIADGMALKVEAAQFAANEIQQSVTICSWDDASKILLEHERCGTEIQADNEDRE